MDIKTRTETVLALLDEHFPHNDKCYLHYSNEWQLLIATILSAQCTDDRVNKVTPQLFEKYKTIDDFADCNVKELENHIKSTGFYRHKAKNIKEACIQLRDIYNYKMPSQVEELVKLAGVGRKTANVVRSHIFNLPSIVVDTHVKRISNRLGFTQSDDPVKIEFELMEIFPQEHWIRYNTQAIALGRTICKARKPDCENCFLAVCCKYCLGE
jgi:endonuclease-3